MDHAEAHERIADLILEPQALRAFDDDPSPTSVALRAHVEKCDECRTELDSWRDTHGIILSVVEEDLEGEPVAALATAENVLRPPIALRTAVASIPSSQPRGAHGVESEIRTDATPSRRRRAWSRLAVVAVAASVVIAVGAVAIAADQTRRVDQQRRYIGELVELTGSVLYVLKDTSHASTVLFDPAGAPGGTALWSTDEIVVMASDLKQPAAGLEYRCWVERDGIRTAIGVMQVGAGMAYWWGELGDDGEVVNQAGGQIGVSLEPIGGSGGGPPLLVGALPA